MIPDRDVCPVPAAREVLAAPEDKDTAALADNPSDLPGLRHAPPSRRRP